MLNEATSNKSNCPAQWASPDSPGDLQNDSPPFRPICDRPSAFMWEFQGSPPIADGRQKFSHRRRVIGVNGREPSGTVFAAAFAPNWRRSGPGTANHGHRRSQPHHQGAPHPLLQRLTSTSFLSSIPTQPVAVTSHLSHPAWQPASLFSAFPLIRTMVDLLDDSLASHLSTAILHSMNPSPAHLSCRVHLWAPAYSLSLSPLVVHVQSQVQRRYQS
jgi:hypothetical protein